AQPMCLQHLDITGRRLIQVERGHVRCIKRNHVPLKADNVAGRWKRRFDREFEIPAGLYALARRLDFSASHRRWHSDQVTARRWYCVNDGGPSSLELLQRLRGTVNDELLYRRPCQGQAGETNEKNDCCTAKQNAHDLDTSTCNAAG